MERFDANSFLYITKALDYFDVTDGYGSLARAFRECRARFLLLTFSSDWLYPPHQLKEVAQAIRRLGKDATYCEIKSDYGHDALLLEHQTQEPMIKSFLERISKEREDKNAGADI